MAFTSDKIRQGVQKASGYTIDQSLRFNDDDSAYLSRTPSSAGNRKTWTWSAWVKRSNLGITTEFMISSNSGDGYYRSYGHFSNSDELVFGDYKKTWTSKIATTQRFRDTSAWYHIIIAYDTTQSTSTDRLKLYVNGQQVTDFSSTIYPSQNYEGYINNTNELNIGYLGCFDIRYADMHLAEVNFIDGQALTPADFGETGDYGEWKPIEYEGTYGTNGFYLDFSDSGSLGTDASSNSNNWTPNNLSATDQMLDSPTNNFCTWNPLNRAYSDIQLSQGNIQSKHTATGGWELVTGSQLMSSGKWYWEVIFTAQGTSVESVGLIEDTETIIGGGLNYAGWKPKGYGWASHDNGFRHNNVSLASPGTYTTGDIMQIAYDADTRKCWIGKNNTWVLSGNPSAGTSPIATLDAPSGSGYYPATAGYGNAINIANFGQDSSFAGNKTAQGNQDSNGIGDFYYTPPTDFLALCTQNLPEPTVVPSEHFNTVLYTGTGATQSITGVGFQPDFIWLKRRSSVQNNNVFDAVRGNTKLLATNTTDAEGTVSQFLNSFDSDGFTVGTAGNVSANGETNVAWNWKAGNATLGTGDFTQGTIASTCSRNVDAGFSIVSYTGTGSAGTVGHGLSSAPELVIVKQRDYAGNHWVTWHGSACSGSQFLYMDVAGNMNTHGPIWNSTVPSSTVFSVGTDNQTNRSGDGLIGYCFHSVDGYSKVGSYTGNGSSDGTFVYTGFRPAYLLMKVTNTASDWHVMDSARDVDNVVQFPIDPNSSSAEYGANDRFDFLSNGFKLRQTSGSFNGNGNTYIYLAFAENPFKHTNAR